MAETKPYQVIARKYRPQGFDEMIGQEAVRTTLENAIAQQRIAHGYIFAGQRGTGKTTAARIVARCLNCAEGPTAHPCGKCAGCVEIAAGNAMDVIEIDAASNRGINEMRELRENVRFRPARDRYKVFIIDEAHQITSEAFNALLKTLEEPPEWVVFLLCTTESHKIPTTIASRCQQFSFRSVDFRELVERMRFICKEEGIAADDEALAVLAQAGEGSVRDSLSALLASDSRRMLDIVEELEANGRNPQHFCRELSRYFRNLLVAKVAGAGTRLIAAGPREQERLAATAQQFSEPDLTRYLHLTLDLFRDLQYSLQPRLHLELGLVRLVQAGRLQSIEDAIAGLGSGTPAPSRPSAPVPAAAPASAAMAKPAAPKPAASGSLKDRLLAQLTEQNMAMSADAVAHADIVESAAEVKFVAPREFTMGLRDSAVAKLVQQIVGRTVKVTVAVGEAQGAPAAVAASKAQESDAERRALEDPSVQRFRKTFPDARLSGVRDLKE
ncbi:MAG: DNA polymerase III subunit gamma/tau [Bryobacter sp.]|nr:DNA polymerase III subunit gamma/tau [Bryobacter sp.]